METNYEEAIRAKDEGKKKFAERDYRKAIKLFQISIRLHPNPDTSQLLHSAQAALARTSENTNSVYPNSSDHWFTYTCRTVHLYLEPLRRLENRWISAQLRPYLRGIIIVIIIISCYKIVFKKKLALYALPGDFSYSSPNMTLHAPIVSCLLISFLANAVNRAFQQKQFSNEILIILVFNLSVFGEVSNSE
jgi:hypothetical protein